MNDNYIKIIEINDKLTGYKKEIKRLKSEKKDIESIIDILCNYNIDDIKDVLSHLMIINNNIKDLSYEIYNLVNKRNNIINKTNKLVSKKKPTSGELVIIKILDELI